MADIIRCLNGHFYDKSLFTTCPHCLSREEQRSTHRIQKEISRLAELYLKAYLEKENENEGTGPAAAEPVIESVEEKAEISPQVPVEEVSAGRSREISKGQPPAGMPLMVTGWLVCIRGYCRGRSFTLGDGYNTVGRRGENRISLPEDPEIMENQICVVYDVRRNQFYLMVAQNSRAALNGEVFSGSRLLQEGDRIQIGGELFDFIPYCKGNRRWIRMPGERMDAFSLQNLKAEGGKHGE